jgi:hypothetical protein
MEMVLSSKITQVHTVFLEGVFMVCISVHGNLGRGGYPSQRRFLNTNENSPAEPVLSTRGEGLAEESIHNIVILLEVAGAAETNILFLFPCHLVRVTLSSSHLCPLKRES